MPTVNHNVMVHKMTRTQTETKCVLSCSGSTLYQLQREFSIGSKCVLFRDEFSYREQIQHMFHLQVAWSLRSTSGERTGVVFAAQKIYIAQRVDTRTCRKQTIRRLQESLGSPQITVTGWRSTEVEYIHAHVVIKQAERASEQRVKHFQKQRQ